jgi:hypothetical protein
MRWQEFVDGYDWKARLIPTGILLLPLFSSVYYFCPGLLSTPLQLAGSGLVWFALIYLASMFFRDRGVRYGKQFWEKRGGLPSTRFCRIRDSHLSADQKNRIQLAVLHKFGIRLMSLEEECESPQLADRQIMNAFREVKEFLRWCDGCGLVDKHGAEYGFVRNLCGSKMVFVVEAIAGFIVCGFKGKWPHWNLNGGCLATVVLLLFWIPFAWLVLPKMLTLNAETYAGRAWVTFLGVAERKAKKPSKSLRSPSEHQWASSE